MRVVLYPEGPAEEGPSRRYLPAPGDRLPEELLGPAHLLVRRCIAEGTRVPAAAVTFEVALVLRGRVPRGSDLRVCKNLHRLLTWPRPADVPDLAVVLVDADGDRLLRPNLSRCIDERPLPRPPVCLGVAEQEFEAWMLADQPALHRVLGRTYGALPAVEGLTPGDAKRIFQEWLALAHPNDPGARREARTAIMDQADLDEIARQCRSFDDVRKQLVRAVSP